MSYFEDWSVDVDKVADQRECPPSSMGQASIELGGHPSRGQAGCGLVALLRSRRDQTSGQLARLFCKRRGCPDCGPRRCTRLLDRYSTMLGDYLEETSGQLVQFTVATTAWASLARKLRRWNLPYLRIPRQDGCDLVITLAGIEGREVEPVDDLHQLLSREFTWTPASVFDRRRPSHAGWDTIAEVTGVDNSNSSASAAGAGSSEPTGWELIGFTHHSYASAIQTCAELGLDQGPVAERDLDDDWAEAHQLRLPPEGSTGWHQMWERLALRTPTAFDLDGLSRRGRHARMREMAGVVRPRQGVLEGIAA